MTYGEGFQKGWADALLGICLMVAWLKDGPYGDGYRAGYLKGQKEKTRG